MGSKADELREKFDKCIKSLDPDDLDEALFVVEDMDDSDEKTKTIAKNLICRAEQVVVNKLGILNNCELNDIHKLLVYSDKLAKFINNSKLPNLPAIGDLEAKQVEVIQGLIDIDTNILIQLIELKSGGSWLSIEQINKFPDNKRFRARRETLEMFIRIYKEELIIDPSWFENKSAKRIELARLALIRECLKLGVTEIELLHCGAQVTNTEIERANRGLSKSSH